MRHKSDDITAPPGEVGFGWNEIQFLEVDELRRMAPSIVGLEIRRLSESCRHIPAGSDLYNAIVAARYELRRFLEALENADESAAASRSRVHLETALIHLGLCRQTADSEVLGVVEYASDRMTHILERMALLY